MSIVYNLTAHILHFFVFLYDTSLLDESIVSDTFFMYDVMYSDKKFHVFISVLLFVIFQCLQCHFSICIHMTSYIV